MSPDYLPEVINLLFIVQKYREISTFLTHGAHPHVNMYLDLADQQSKTQK